MFVRRAQVALSQGSAVRIFARFWSCACRCWNGEDRKRARRAEVVSMVAHTGSVWIVDDSIEILAHIACWHKTVEHYRGYVLCADREQRVFLVDKRSWRYVRASPTQLLMVEGVGEAKALVDAFCLHLQT
jgi:hypothetical protein